MNAGDTFLLSVTERKYEPHLCIVISDPVSDPDEVLFVKLITWSESADQSCKLVGGDHSYVTRDSCIAYGRARVCSLEHLVSLRETGSARMQEPVSAEVLQLIRDGAAKSKFIELGKREILRRQGLIE